MAWRKISWTRNKTIKSLLNRLKSSYNNLIRNNTGVSVKNWLIFVVSIIGSFLLLVPGICLLVEVFNNHTIQTDLNGFATYIGAIAGLFASVIFPKVWSEKYENKSKKNEGREQNEE